MTLIEGHAAVHQRGLDGKLAVVLKRREVHLRRETQFQTDVCLGLIHRGQVFVPVELRGLPSRSIVVFSVEVHRQQLYRAHIATDGQGVHRIDIVVARRRTLSLGQRHDILSVNEAQRPDDILHGRRIVAGRDVALRILDDQFWLQLIRRECSVGNECTQHRIIFLLFAAAKLHHGEGEAQRRMQ